MGQLAKKVYYISNIKNLFAAMAHVSNEHIKYIPVKKLAISSLLQPYGSPLNLTTASDSPSC